MYDPPKGVVFYLHLIRTIHSYISAHFHVCSEFVVHCFSWYLNDRVKGSMYGKSIYFCFQQLGLSNPDMAQAMNAENDRESEKDGSDGYMCLKMTVSSYPSSSGFMCFVQ